MMGVEAVDRQLSRCLASRRIFEAAIPPLDRAASSVMTAMLFGIAALALALGATIAMPSWSGQALILSGAAMAASAVLVGRRWPAWGVAYRRSCRARNAYLKVCLSVEAQTPYLAACSLMGVTPCFATREALQAANLAWGKSLSRRLCPSHAALLFARLDADFGVPREAAQESVGSAWRG